MEVTVVGRRPTLALIVVLAILFLLMSSDARTVREGDDRTLFARGVMSLFSPIPRFVGRVDQTASDLVRRYVDFRDAVRDNERLRDELRELTRENVALRSAHGDLSRMRALLDYADQFSMPTLYARVVLVDTSDRFKSIVIDQGAGQGVEVNDPVVSDQGLIGRVVMTTEDLAKVQLLIDTNAAVGVLVERTRRQGVVRGDGSSSLRLDYVPSLADVIPSDKLISSGTDGVYPGGIEVGTIAEVTEGKELFKMIRVSPAADFGAIEEVLVLRTQKLPPEVVRYQP